MEMRNIKPAARQLLQYPVGMRLAGIVAAVRPCMICRNEMLDMEAKDAYIFIVGMGTRHHQTLYRS